MIDVTIKCLGLDDGIIAGVISSVLVVLLVLVLLLAAVCIGMKCYKKKNQ